MEYRGVEYTVVQGIERGVWKWSVSLGNPKMIKVGQAKNKQDAVAEVERAIDRRLLERSCDCAARTQRLTDAGFGFGERGGDPMMANIAMMPALNKHKPKAAPVPRRKRAKGYRIIR